METKNTSEISENLLPDQSTFCSQNLTFPCNTCSRPRCVDRTYIRLHCFANVRYKGDINSGSVRTSEIDSESRSLFVMTASELHCINVALIFHFERYEHVSIRIRIGYPHVKSLSKCLLNGESQRLYKTLMPFRLHTERS